MARIWPNIELQWEGSGPTPCARRRSSDRGAGDRDGDSGLARGGLEVQLGTHQGGRRAHRDDGGQRALPAGSRAAGGNRHQAGRRHRAGGSDLIVLAVPSAGVPAAIGATADRIGGRSAVLILTKGLVPLIGTLPTAHVAERVRARAIASAGPPRTRARRSAAWRRSCSKRRRGPAPAARGIDRRLAGRADRGRGRRGDGGRGEGAAALAAAAAEPHGLNAAGIAATEVWRECVDLTGGRREPGHVHGAWRPARPHRDGDGARKPQPASRASCSGAGLPPRRYRNRSGRRRRRWTPSSVRGDGDGGGTTLRRSRASRR